jgi:hypothetical protein
MSMNELLLTICALEAQLAATVHGSHKYTSLKALLETARDDLREAAADSVNHEPRRTGPGARGSRVYTPSSRSS